MMKEIKTVNGYINATKRLEKNTTMCLKGYDKLSKEKKEILGIICASLGNLLGEWNNAQDNNADFGEAFEGVKKDENKI